MGVKRPVTRRSNYKHAQFREEKRGNSEYLLFASHRFCIRRSIFTYIVCIAYKYFISLLPILCDRKTEKSDEESDFLTFAVVLHFYCFTAFEWFGHMFVYGTNRGTS